MTMTVPTVDDLPQRVRAEATRHATKYGEIWTPKSIIGFKIFKALKYLPEDLALEIVEQMKSLVVAESSLSLKHIHGPESDAPFTIDEYGIVSRKVVTDTGVGFIVDAFQNTVEIENLKFHGIGTGGAAEAVGNTALTTELTTQYNPDNTRATGSTTETSANIYRTVGTNTVDSAVAITEHGILSQAATGGGVLLDRSLFSVVNMASADSLQSTYDLTLTSGG
jgi:hypothetical protein